MVLIYVTGGSFKFMVSYRLKINPKVTLSRVYEVNFDCVYDIRFYPFDIHVCSVDMVMAGSAAMFIALKPGGIVYFVIDMLIKRAKVKNKSGVKVSFLLGRNLLGNIFTDPFKPRLFQRLFLQSCCHCQPDLHACLSHHIHQCFKQPSKDLVYQND